MQQLDMAVDVAILLACVAGFDFTNRRGSSDDMWGRCAFTTLLTGTVGQTEELGDETLQVECAYRPSYAAAPFTDNIKYRTGAKADDDVKAGVGHKIVVRCCCDTAFAYSRRLLTVVCCIWSGTYRLVAWSRRNAASACQTHMQLTPVRMHMFRYEA